MSGTDTPHDDRSGSASEKSQAPSKKHRWIVTAVLVALTAIVILQNTAETETRVLFFTLTMPRALLLAIVFAVGVLTGMLLARHRRKRKMRKILAD